MDDKIEQVHEDWKKGQYEHELTKMAFKVSSDISESKRIPVRPYLQKAVASLSELLNIMISGDAKNNAAPFIKNLKKLDNLYLLLNQGIAGMSFKINKSDYTLSWEQGGRNRKECDLTNKQAIPLILSEIFRETMSLGPKLGFFLQKPFEKRSGVAAYFEAGGFDIAKDEDGS